MTNQNVMDVTDVFAAQLSPVLYLFVHHIVKSYASNTTFQLSLVMIFVQLFGVLVALLLKK
jgi:hypothetical protein